MRSVLDVGAAAALVKVTDVGAWKAAGRPELPSEGSIMPTRPFVLLKPGRDGRWVVDRNGTKRTTMFFDNWPAAEASALAAAVHEGVEVLVQGVDSRVHRHTIGEGERDDG